MQPGETRDNPVEASSKRLRVWQAVWKSTCLVASQDKPQMYIPLLMKAAIH